VSPGITPYVPTHSDQKDTQFLINPKLFFVIALLESGSVYEVPFFRNLGKDAGSYKGKDGKGKMEFKMGMTPSYTGVANLDCFGNLIGILGKPMSESVP